MEPISKELERQLRHLETRVQGLSDTSVENSWLEGQLLTFHNKLDNIEGKLDTVIELLKDKEKIKDKLLG